VFIEVDNDVVGQSGPGVAMAAELVDKIPRFIRLVEEFPMTITGKVQKYKMREEMSERLASGLAGIGESID